MATSDAARFAALALAAYALAVLCIMFTRDHGQVAAIWPGNALALAIILRSPPPRWGVYAAAATSGLVLANLSVGDPAGRALLLAACNGGEILIAAALASRLARTGLDVTSPRQLLSLSCVALAAPVVPALMATAVMGDATSGTFLRWYLADALGLMVVTPAVLALAVDLGALKTTFQRKRNIAPVLALTVALALAFGQETYPVLFLLFLPLVWCAMTLGSAGVSLVLLVTTVVAVVSTLSGHGTTALIQGDMQTKLAVLQVLLATMTLVTLPLTAVLAERRRLNASLLAALAKVGESETRYRLLADNASDMIIKYDGDGTIRYASPSVSKMGYAPEDLIGRSAWDLTHPEDLHDTQARIAEMQQAGAATPDIDRTFRFLAADGQYVWVEANPSIVVDKTTNQIGFVSQIRDISARKAAEESLMASEARYRMLADYASDLVVKIDAAGALNYVSPSFKRLGYEPEEMIGHSPLSFIHPDDAERVAARLSARRTPGQLTNLEPETYRILKKQGGFIWVEGNPSPVFNPDGSLLAVISQLRDVTVHKAAEDALAESEARYRMLADHATDIILKVDAEDTILYVSPSVTRYGYDPEQLVGISGYTLMHPDDLPTLRSLIAELFRDGVVDASRDRTYRIRTASGEYVWMEGNPSLVRDEAGKVEAVISQLRDVSVRKLLEADLLAARDEAQAVAATKAEFMANMSHEVRTPLTAVLGFTGLLSSRDDLAADARRQVERIGAAGQAMLAIVNDVLDFSKLEAGLMPVTPRPTAPLEVLETALALFEPQAEAKGLRLSFEASDLPAHVEIDPDRTRQVLLNLIGNAVKFTDDGEVAVSAIYADGRLKVSVRDSGAGMTEAQQARLFQRFSHVDGDAARAGGGTGLGLAICRGLVEAMGGEIGLTSAVGQGSTFTFEIPAPVCAAAAGPEEASPLAGVAGLRVLVVDDNPTNRELAHAVMAQFGVEVTDARDGAEAVELAAQWPYDVILLDIRMPVMDGPTAARRIRGEPGPNRDTPILAFSADHQLDETVSGLFDGHVRKPMEVTPLLEALVEATAWEDALYAAEG